MIQIDEPPAKTFCASCDQQLTWLYSASKEAWICFVACGCERWSVKPHTCRHAQDPRLWREVRTGDPPNDDYLAAKKALKSANEGDGS